MLLYIMEAIMETTYTTDFAVDFADLAEQCELLEINEELASFVSLLNASEAV